MLDIFGHMLDVSGHDLDIFDDAHIHVFFILALNFLYIYIYIYIHILFRFPINFLYIPQICDVHRRRQRGGSSAPPGRLYDTVDGKKIDHPGGLRLPGPPLWRLRRISHTWLLHMEIMHFTYEISIS